MPITDPDLKITIRYTIQGQKCQNAQWYRTSGAAFLTADAEGVGEAWWNDVKTAWRALIINSAEFKFVSVVVQEGNPAGAFGEFSIPPAEQQGTRAAGSLGAFLPTFNAASVRLSVSSRVTRPGQKRFPGLSEGDSDGQVIGAAYQTLLDAVALKYSSVITLGAPVATGTLTPEVVTLSGVPAVVVARQDVTGYVTNPYISSQVSRKIGHGQ